jgi:hypothetical protein
MATTHHHPAELVNPVECGFCGRVCDAADEDTLLIDGVYWCNSCTIPQCDVCEEWRHPDRVVTDHAGRQVCDEGECGEWLREMVAEAEHEAFVVREWRLNGGAYR